jgi:hypothetical protein
MIYDTSLCKQHYDDLKLLQGETACFGRRALKFIGSCSLLLQGPSTLKMEVADSSETMVHIYETACCHFPEDNPVHSQHLKNKKSHIAPSSYPFSGLPTFCVLSHNEFSPSVSAFSIIIIESNFKIHCWLPGCITASPFPLLAFHFQCFC